MLKLLVISPHGAFDNGCFAIKYGKSTIFYMHRTFSSFFLPGHSIIATTPFPKQPALCIQAFVGAFRHRCGARSSKPVGGRDVPGRFDSYTLPPPELPPCLAGLFCACNFPFTPKYIFFGPSASQNRRYYRFLPSGCSVSPYSVAVQTSPRSDSISLPYTTLCTSRPQPS